MDMIGKVRRMHRRDKKSVREIARLTGLSRNTVAEPPRFSWRLFGLSHADMADPGDRR